MLEALLIAVGLSSPFLSSDWTYIPDLEVEHAQRLSPKTVAFHNEYPNGIVEVVHIVGPTEYRILTVDGNVSYSYRIQNYIGEDS